MADIDNLGIQQQLNKLFADRIPLLTKSTQEMQSQLKIAVQLRAVMDNLSSGELTDKLNEASKALEDVADKASHSGDIANQALKSMADNTEIVEGEMISLSKLTEDVGKKGGKSFGLLSRSMKGAVAVSNSLISVGKGVLSFFYNTGKAVAAIPLRFFSNLLNDAAEFAGDPSLMQAIEDVRKEFGDLKTGTSKDVLDASQSISSGLEKTGLSVYQVFETPAERLKYMTELFKGAGSQALQFGGELAKSGGIIAAFDKGLGLGAENLKGFMNRATVLGTDLQEQLRVTANYSLQLGKTFGISQKILSKDVGSMMKDVKNFGSLTQKQMVVSSIYTRKLGLETKDLLNLIDKFDNFEDAANSAAMLSQAFGANVDAFKLMNEQDPAKRLDELRKSMQAAGKSTENMTRQELKLLAQTSGLSEEAAKLAFSQKNQGLSYDQIQKQANKAENAQLKQTEALEKLAASIERVVRSGQTMQGSFFGQFKAGFERGTKMSEQYVKTMINVKSALHKTFMAGDQVGRLFMNSEHLGVGKFFKSVSNIFDPQKVNKLFNGYNGVVKKNGKDTIVHYTGIVDHFKDLFSGNINVKEFFDRVKSQFLQFFKGSKDDAANVKDGAIKFAKRVAKGFGEFTVYAIHELTKSFRKIADFIRNPKEFLEKLKETGKGTKSVGGQIIESFTSAFNDPKMLSDLWSSIKDLVGLLAGKVTDLVKSNPELRKIAMSLGFAMFGPKVLGPVFSLGGPVLKGVSSIIGPAFSALGAAGAPLAIGAAIAGLAYASTGINKGIAKYTNTLIKDGLNPAQAKVGAASAGIIDAITFGLLPEGTSLEIGKSISKLSDKVIDGFGNIFGASFSGRLKTLFSSQIDFLGALGDTFSAIFSGDSEAMTKAFSDLGEKFFSLLSNTLKTMIDFIPRLINKISQFAFKFVGSIFTAIGDGIKNLGADVPILHYITDWIGDISKGFGTLSQMISEAFSKFNKVWDAKDKLTSLSGISGTIASVFSKKAEQKETKPTLEKPEVPTEPVKQQPTEQATAALVMNVNELGAKKKTLEESIKSLQDVANSDSINKAGVVITNLEKSLDEFNKKFSVTGIGNTLEVTQQIARTVNELNEALGQTGANAMTMTTKLQKFADNSGLGKSGTYEIKNKGIVLKLDLKVVMDAGDVEKAIVLRKDSIIFDALEDMPSLNINNPEYKSGFDRLRQQKGGG